MVPAGERRRARHARRAGRGDDPRDGRLRRAGATATPSSATSCAPPSTRPTTRKRDLLTLVRDSFTTPLDPEDLFELSRGLDEVINGAKNTVREAEALGDAAERPDGRDVRPARRRRRAAWARRSTALGDDPATADAEAAAAVKTQRNLERTYRRAMAKLVEKDDMREVVGRQELYRRADRASRTNIVHVADRVMYATVKES